MHARVPARSTPMHCIVFADCCSGCCCAAELASHAEAEAATASRDASPAAAAAGAGRTAGADGAAAGTPTPDPLLAAEQPRATPAAEAAADVERWLEQLRAEHTCVPQLGISFALLFPCTTPRHSPLPREPACHSMHASVSKSGRGRTPQQRLFWQGAARQSEAAVCAPREPARPATSHQPPAASPRRAEQVGARGGARAASGARAARRCGRPAVPRWPSWTR